MLLALASRRQAPPSSTSTQRPGKRLPVKAGIQTLCTPFFTVYRCARLSEIEVQLCRLTWFKRRIIDGSLRGTIHNQRQLGKCPARDFQNVTTVLICF